MPSLRFVRLAASSALVLALAACSASESPGWTYAPAPPATPAPSGEASPGTSPAASVPASSEPSPGATPTLVPSASAPAGESPGTSGEPAESPAVSGAPGGDTLTLTALNIEFVEKELSAPAETPFQITLDNQDAGIPHDVDIRDAGGATIDDNEIFPGVAEMTFDVPALAAGEYTFICSVHPIPAMTGTLTVQ